jgi:hypothetical protein
LIGDFAARNGVNLGIELRAPAAGSKNQMLLRSRAFVAAFVISVLSLETSPTVQGQAAPPASQATPQNTPTFRTGVRLIDLDVFVTDKDGKFVGDLHPRVLAVDRPP